MNMGLSYWYDECDKMEGQTLDKLEKMVCKEYMSRALRSLTLNEMKKLILHIRKTRGRKYREAKVERRLRAKN